MTNEFNADDFCSQMQDKAKELAKVKKNVDKQRTKKGTITLIINGKRIEHELPCHVKDCETCVLINEIQGKIDRMMLDMRTNLFDIFGDLF